MRDSVERTITARFHNTCVECKGPIKPGDTIRYTPATSTAEVKRQYRSNEGYILLRDTVVNTGSTVRHMPGQCTLRTEYTVRIIYASTSKSMRVAADTPEQAIQKATPKSKYASPPVGYVVSQGNVEVLRRVA